MSTKITYVLEPLPRECMYSLFLMGPTLGGRAGTLTPWRAEALRLLDQFGFAGEVFVPELREGPTASPADQLTWEDAALNQADRILVWSPPDMVTRPVLTNDNDWAYWKARDPARLTLGSPNDYHYRHCVNQPGISIFTSLEAEEVSSKGNAEKV